MSKNRNSILDMMRFYFAIIILLYHSPQPIICFSQQLFIKGYIGVEFFFMCSGLFLIRSLKKYTEKIVTNKLYFLRIVYYKFKKIILYSILVFFLCYIFYFITSKWNLFIAVQQLFLHLPEMLLLSVTGIVGDYTMLWCKPFWYLSVLLILTFFFIYMYSYKKTLLLYMSFVFPLLIYGYLFNKYGTINVWGENVLEIPYGAGILRGCAGMFFGVIINLIIEKINISKFLKNRSHINLIMILEIFILICFTVISVPFNDIFIVFIIASFITLTFYYCNSNTNFYSKVSNLLGEISLPIYMIQPFTIPMSLFLVNGENVVTFYIGFSLVLSFMTYYLYLNLIKKLSNNDM